MIESVKISAQTKSGLAQKGVVNPVLIAVGGIIVVIIAISVASGALKFEGSISKTSDKPQTTSETPSKQPDEPKEESAASTKTYNKSGISVDYPEGWIVRENPSAGVIVAFGSPKESEADTFVDNVNVSTSDLSSKADITLDQVATLWQKQTEEDMAAGGTFKVLETKSDQLVGEDAKRLIYTYSKEGIDIKGMVVIALKDKKAYIVTYTAEEKSFDKFLNVANTIVSSLQVN